MKPAEQATRVESFDAMLASLRFSTRPVQSEEPTSATPVDGTYQMSISWPTIKTADARCVGGEEGTSAKVIYDLTLELDSHLNPGPTAPSLEGLEANPNRRGPRHERSWLAWRELTSTEGWLGVREVGRSRTHHDSSREPGRLAGVPPHMVLRPGYVQVSPRHAAIPASTCVFRRGFGPVCSSHKVGQEAFW
jgi:hypothetical protein